MLIFVPDGGARGGRGRPRQRYIHTIKIDLLARNIYIIVIDQVSLWSVLSDVSHERVAWRVVANSDVLP